MTEEEMVSIVVGPYSNKFQCLVDIPCHECKWFQPYWKSYTFGDLIHIGWCQRFTPDPDAGYVALHKNPPCLTWGYERTKAIPKEGSDDKPGNP